MSTIYKIDVLIVLTSKFNNEYIVYKMKPKPIVNHSELPGQNGSETSCLDDGLRLLGKIIARQLMHKHEGDATCLKADNLRETTKTNENIS